MMIISDDTSKAKSHKSDLRSDGVVTPFQGVHVDKNVTDHENGEVEILKEKDAIHHRGQYEKPFQSRESVPNLDVPSGRYSW